MIVGSGVPIYASLEKAGISAPPTFTSYSLATEIADWLPIKGWIDNLSGAAGKYLNVSYIAKNWSTGAAFALESGDMLVALNDSGTNLAYGLVLDSLYQASPIIWMLKDVITGNPVSLLKGSSTSYKDMYILKMKRYGTGTSIKNIDFNSTLMRLITSKTPSGTTIKLSDFYGKTQRLFVSYNIPGTYSYTIPTSPAYYKISFLVVGGGGGGKGSGGSTTVSVAGGGGGGGAVYYYPGIPKENSNSINPGHTLSIVVGSGGASGSPGTNSSIYNTTTATMLGNAGGGGSGTAGCRTGATGGSCLMGFGGTGAAGGAGFTSGSTPSTFVRAGGGGGAGSTVMVGGLSILAANTGSAATSGCGGRGAYQGDNWQYDQSFFIGRYLGGGGGGGGATGGGLGCSSNSGGSNSAGNAAGAGTGGGGGGAGKSYSFCLARTYCGGAGGSGGVYITLFNNY